MSQSLLAGLTPEDALLTFRKILFRPSLEDRIGTSLVSAWCVDLLQSAKDPEAFASRYNNIADHMHRIAPSGPAPSMENLPWSMISIDLMIAAVPWVTPLFNRWLHRFLLTRG